jgi:hypothetical protein
MKSCKLFYENGTFWATTCAGPDCAILRSTSGSMMGPWETVRVGYPGGIKGSAKIKKDKEGDFWIALRSQLWPVTPDMKQDLDRPVRGEDGYRPPSGRANSYEVETADGCSFIRGDVGRYYYQVDGKYLMLGTAWHGNYRRFGTYDAQVFWANDIIGPYHHSRTVLPHGGHSGIVKDNDGQWWMTSFTNDGFLPDNGVRAVPIDLEWNGRRFTVKSANPGDASLTWEFEPEIVRPGPIDIQAAYPTLEIPGDLPIRDPAVCPVEEDGQTVYYLTGTAGTEVDGELDFHNTGIYLWKSADLKNWQPLGKVFEMGRDNPSTGFTAGRALGYHYSPPDSLEPRYDRGLIAPELHHVKDDYYLVASPGRQGVAVFKSKTGRPEGPYGMVPTRVPDGKTALVADSGTESEGHTDAYFFGYDPSLFEDADGSVYLLFGNGWIAKMKDDLTGMAGLPRRLRLKSEELGCAPLQVGKGGCFLRRLDGRYRLTDTTQRGDVVEATSDLVYGPYEGRRIVLPRAGQVAFFEGADGKWTAVAR